MSRKKNENKKPGSLSRHRTVYLLNIIFMSCLTLASLLFAMVIFFRVRTRGTDGLRRLYTDSQISAIKEEAAGEGKKQIKDEIRSSMESGDSTTGMLRKIFDDRIVVVSGGRYAFYPVADNVEESPIEPGALAHHGSETAEYEGDSAGVELQKGALLSDDNGKIDWDRLSESGIPEVVIRGGRIRTRGFVEDHEAERNLREAIKRKIPFMLCLEMEDTAGSTTLFDAADDMVSLLERSAWGEEGGAGSTREALQGEGTYNEALRTDTNPVRILIRIQSREDLSIDSSGRKLWDDSVGSLCGELEHKGLQPVVGGSVYTFAALIDPASLARYERWLIDHEEYMYFPYYVTFWEYSRDGHLEGVPGKSLLYTRIRITADFVTDQIKNQQ